MIDLRRFVWAQPSPRFGFLPLCVGLFALSTLFAHAQTASPSTPPSAASSSAAPAQTQTTPPVVPSKEETAEEKTEMRGMWVVRGSLASPQSVHQVVVTAVKYHLNTLFVQVRGRGDAWYDSSFEPRAEQLAGQPRSFDPLAQIVAEAHANGLQVHAWMNTFLTWSGSKAPHSPAHLWNAHRDWFACDREGRCSCLPNSSSEGAFLQPSNPAVQEHLRNVFTEVAAKYDVDGIHFDYCRYCSSGYDFSSSTLARFRAFLLEEESANMIARMRVLDGRLHSDRLAYVHAFPSQWEAWRRDQITQLVAGISQEVKRNKPWMQVSAAVFADAADAFKYRGQDWQGWIQAGYLDAVALMAYDKNTARVVEQTRRAVAIAGERYVYTGIGAWRLQAHDVAAKIALIRRAGATGVNLFSYDGVHNRSRYLDTLARGVFASRAAPPHMRWLPSREREEGRGKEGKREESTPDHPATTGKKEEGNKK